jgi:hypothetical protein
MLLRSGIEEAVYEAVLKMLDKRSEVFAHIQKGKK